MVARTWLGWLTAFLVFSASATAHAQCAMDTECKGDRVCEAGQCVAPPPAAAQSAPAPAPAPAPAAPPSVVYLAPAPQPASAAPTKPEEPKTERASVGLMAGGITLISIAPIALLIAAVAAAEKGNCKRYPDSGAYVDTDNGTITYGREDCDRYDPTIYGFTIGGIALFAAGIPMFVAGSRRVPVKDDSVTARVSPWISRSGGGATLRLDL